MINNISSINISNKSTQSRTNTTKTISFGLIDGGTTISKAASRAQKLYNNRKTHWFFKLFKKLNPEPKTEMRGGHTQLIGEDKIRPEGEW